MDTHHWIKIEDKMPLHCATVLVKAPGYAVAEAIYVKWPFKRADLAVVPAGFHLLLGGGQTVLADHVKWWFPAPLPPA